ncbi:MAG: hypothetical protein AAF502_01095 [Bacteroidota bacterium]
MNQQFFNGLFPAFGSYARDAFATLLLSEWIFVILPVVISWVLVTVYLKFRKSKETVGRVTEIHLAWVLVGALVSLGFLGYFVFRWGTGYYKETTAEFWHLMSFLVSMIVLLVSFARLSGQFDREKIHNLIRQPLTTRQRKRRVLAMRQLFGRLKLALLLIPLGFVIIPLLKAPNNLVSIVIDNTASMNQPLEHGKEALTTTIEELDDKTDILLTYFPDDIERDNYDSDINDIMSASRSSQLAGVSAFYQDKDAAIEGVQNIELLKLQTNFSPLFEVIRHNWLRTEEEVSQQDGVINYKAIVSVIVTDGQENIVRDSLNGTRQMFCDDSTYSTDFFDQVFFIDIFRSDLGTSVNSVLFDNIDDCEYEILAGSDLSSYEQSLEDILGDFGRDWHFIAWLVIIYLLMALIITIIRPKKLV